jgi:hypothetical protein
MLEMWWEGDGPRGAQVGWVCAPLGLTLTSYTGTRAAKETPMSTKNALKTSLLPRQ